MEVRQLRYFVRVAELGSISRAAEALYVAQPSLSAQISNLEAELGCQLLTRSSRGVTMTERGQEFYRRAQQLLKQWHSLTDIGKDEAQGPTGHVVIGLPFSVSSIIATSLLQNLLTNYPGITVRLDETPSAYLGEMLLNGRLDVSVLFDPNLSRGMTSEHVLEEDLFAIGPGIAGEEIEFAALEGLRLVMPAAPNSVRTLIDDACHRTGVRLNMVAESTSPPTMLQLARAGVAATVLPWASIANSGVHRESGMVAARLANPTLTRGMSVAVSSQASQEPAIVIVRQLVASTMRSLVEDGTWRGTRLL